MYIFRSFWKVWVEREGEREREEASFLGVLLGVHNRRARP